MSLLKCSSCKINLSNSAGPTQKVGGFYWLRNNDYMTRICLCVDCKDKPDFKVINTIAPKQRNLELAFDCDLNGFIKRMNGDYCFDCRLSFGDIEPYRDGWKLYHPKCRGIYDNLFKTENKTEERRASQKARLHAEGKGSISRS